MFSGRSPLLHSPLSPRSQPQLSRRLTGLLGGRRPRPDRAHSPAPSCRQSVGSERKRGASARIYSRACCVMRRDVTSAPAGREVGGRTRRPVTQETSNPGNRGRVRERRQSGLLGAPSSGGVWKDSRCSVRHWLCTEFTHAHLRDVGLIFH